MADVVSPSVAPAAPTVVTVAPAPPASLTLAEGADALAKLRIAKAAPPAEATVPAPVPDSTTSEVAENDTDEVDTEATVEEPTVSEVEDTTDDSQGEDPVVFEDDNGKPVTKTEARKGYLRQQDYTVKTQQTTEVRETAEQRIQIVDKAAEFYAARLPMLIDRIKATIPAEPDQALRTTDAVKYWDTYNERQRQLAELDKFEAEHNAAKEAREYANTLAAQETYIIESGKLLDKLPEWKNPRVAAKERADITAYGRKIGYTDAELAKADHRAVIALRDAALGAKIRANGGKKVASTDVNPTISSRNATGAGATAGKPVPVKTTVTPAAKVDPSASGHERFQQGVAMLRARRATS